MRLRGILFMMFALMLMSVGGVLAQDEVGSLAGLIDQRAAANGLSSGNGQISAAEQSLSTAIINDVTGFNQTISEFEQAATTNSAWVESAEQTVQQFNRKIESAPAQGDPRAQAISDAVAQYGQDAEAVQAQAPNDPRAQAISDAVAQYGNEPVIDPRGQAISDAVAQYGNENSGVDPRAQAISDAVAQYGRESVDPRAQAISDAVAQYGQEIAQSQGKDSLSAEDQQRVTNTVRESANEYVDQANSKRPGISKRHINHLVQFMVPNAMLPINGYWRVVPFSMTTSGSCINTYGDNDGPSNGDGENDPGQPLCGYANAGALPFILWNGDDIPYLPGSSSIYSQMPREDFEIVRDSDGASTGSVKVTTTVEYEVVAPDEIHVHLLIQEDGGCSMSADYTLKLVTADEAVCPPMTNVSTPEPTPEPPPVVVEGPYQVGLPIFNDETQCNEANTPPDFDEVRLLEQDDKSVVIDYGTGMQTVYFAGNGYYEFDSGMDGALRQDISLVLFGGGGSISWSNNAKDGNICFVSRDLTLPGSASEVNPAPVPADSSSTDSGSTGDASSGDASGAGLTPGDYTVTWSDFPGLACPADLQSNLPKFPQATIAASGADYTLAGGGTSYTLTAAGVNYVYTSFGSDNSGILIAISGGMTPEELVGSYTYLSADGVTCMSQLTFTKN